MIRLLHDYNESKDVAQDLFGKCNCSLCSLVVVLEKSAFFQNLFIFIVAGIQNMTLKQIHEKFDINLKDSD
jgi:hypothetical protein